MRGRHYGRYRPTSVSENMTKHQTLSSMHFLSTANHATSEIEANRLKIDCLTRSYER